MKLYQIALFATVVTTFYIHIKNQEPMRKARRRMLAAIRKKGGDSVVWGIGWDITMLDDPNFILRGSDDAEIHALKMDFINKWKDIRRGSHFTIKWLVCGIVISLVIAVIESLF
jgi:hypothetical protein